MIFSPISLCFFLMFIDLSIGERVSGSNLINMLVCERWCNPLKAKSKDDRMFDDNQLRIV